MQVHLAGKVVVITGASSGIGEATARAMARRGARVALVGRREGELRRVADSIEAAGGAARAFSADLADPGAVTQMADAVRADVGVPDAIVNNAGAGQWKALVDTEPAEARAMMEVPYLAAFYVTRAFLPDMLRRGSGHVANVSSPASYMVWPNACGYIAARHALTGFTEALRAELRGSGVGVSLVVLGVVNSPYWERNPGSREHLPRPIPGLMRELSCEQAGETVVRAVEHGSRRVVRPPVFRALFLLSALRGA